MFTHTKQFQAMPRNKNRLNNIPDVISKTHSGEIQKLTVEDSMI